MAERLVYHDWHHAFDEQFERVPKIEGVTKKQREYIHRMWNRVYGLNDDENLCAFPIEKNGGLYMHGKVEKWHCHHILPKTWAAYVLGWDSKRINSPFNLVPICPHHHTTDRNNRYIVSDDFWNEWVEVLHPDMAAAFKEYDGTSASSVSYTHLTLPTKA